jgi:ferric-dicitrate binding protein FerR (iron transport regulator)
MAAAYYALAPNYQSYATGVGGRASFTLADGSRIELNTDTVVRILMRSDQHAATLTPGDVAIASSTAFSVTHKAAMDVAKQLSWRRGVLVFNDTPLAEAARELNRYNSTQIVIADAAVGRIGLGGTFATNNVAGFARVAKNLLHLQVENRGDAIVISR